MAKDTPWSERRKAEHLGGTRRADVPSLNSSKADDRVSVPRRRDLTPDIAEDESEISAKLGGFRACIRWRRATVDEAPHPHRKTKGPNRRHRLPFVLGIAASFVLGSALATVAAWELVPYVETTRVVAEMVNLRMTGTLCVLGSIALYLIRRLFHH